MSAECTSVTVTAIAQALASQGCSEVRIWAELGNSGIVYVGSVDTQTIELAAGDSCRLPVERNADEIYVKGTPGDKVSTWVSPA